MRYADPIRFCDSQIAAKNPLTKPEWANCHTEIWMGKQPGGNLNGKATMRESEWESNQAVTEIYTVSPTMLIAIQDTDSFTGQKNAWQKNRTCKRF